jgi:hypothetical protein
VFADRLATPQKSQAATRKLSLWPAFVDVRAIAGGDTLQNASQNSDAPLQKTLRCASARLVVIVALAVLCPNPTIAEKSDPLIVVGFMGGRVHAGNLIHREALLTRDLDQRYPDAVRAMTFANHDQQRALQTVLKLLDTSRNGLVSESEKSAARIVLFGHSWGASEAVHFAKELDRRGIPVLLTIQVDSVEKTGEDDGTIPSNVREAINFYQSDGLLHGRSSIHAIDPKRTKILGSYESTYRTNPVSCSGFGWFARAFMKPHIEIENDGALWDKIEALIVARSFANNLDATVTARAEK